jgi:hypothetical protein
MDDPDLDRQLVRRGVRNVSAAFEHGLGLGKWVQEDAHANAPESMQFEAHRGDDAEIAAAAAKRP